MKQNLGIDNTLLIQTIHALIILSSIGLIVTGEGIAFLGFMERHPSILAKMVTFGLASAAGQVRETIIILN